MLINNENSGFSILDFSSDFEVVSYTIPIIKGSNGSGFLCCTRVIVDDGYIGISIPF